MTTTGRNGALLLGILLGVSSMRGAYAAERRVALVIGNSKYTTVSPLLNPVNDATDVAHALKKAGFQVKLVLNANKQQMEAAVSILNKTLQGGGTGLFYFAGHGVQVEGENYLIPVDADISGGADVEYRAVKANWILETMQENQNDLNILILDACRNNPFPMSHRGGSKGLAQMNIAKGSFLAYSTSPGKVADDGQKGDRNSPFTKHLVRFLQEPGVQLEQMFKHVRESVVSETSNRQTPWDASTVVGEFYFVPPDGVSPSTPLLETTPSPGAAPPPATPSTPPEEWSMVDRPLCLWARCRGGTASAAAPAPDPAQVAALPPAALAAPSQEWSMLDRPLCLWARCRGGTASAVPLAMTEGGEMVSVQEGEFYMGCNQQVDKECFDNEKPGQRINVGTFQIDKTEVTVAAYRRCVEAGSCSAPGMDKDCNWEKSERERHPINCVDWEQARTYCQWARKRLPSEAEWEKAARGTDGYKYSWGNTSYRAAGLVANIVDATAKQAGNSWGIASYKDKYAETAPVGSFLAGRSPYGALDMIGNVGEWTAGWYDSDHKYRAMRGGSWGDRPQSARASYRIGYGPGKRDEYSGFRCAQ